jgi:hypothetical protein
MTSQLSAGELIATLEQAVAETLAFFEGPGRDSDVRIDRWGAREVLAHFPYWHYATAWGIESASAGGPPWLLPDGADGINEVCEKLHEGEDFDDLIARLRVAQGRLVRAARRAGDLDAPAFRMPNGREVTIGQRLDILARHWRGHLADLQGSR